MSVALRRQLNNGGKREIGLNCTRELRSPDCQNPSRLKEGLSVYLHLGILSDGALSIPHKLADTTHPYCSVPLIPQHTFIYIPVLPAALVSDKS